MRTNVLFASKANVAVLLLRRGKSHFHLINWNLDDHSFKHGQWMKGDVRLCDLTPDGSKLVYFAAQRHRKPIQVDDEAVSPLYSGGSMKEIYAFDLAHQKKRKNRKTPKYMAEDVSDHLKAPAQLADTWTAISNPPFFTALCLWPAFGTWTGGGCFPSETELCIFESADRLPPYRKQPPPPQMKLWGIGEGENCLQDDEIQPSAFSPSDEELKLLQNLCPRLESQGLQRCDWLFHYRNNDLLFSGDGKLFCQTEWDGQKDSIFLDKAQVLADFSDLRFTLLKPPKSAMKW